MSAGVTARLLEQTARAIYERRGPSKMHPGQWAVLRYLPRAPRAARTISGIAVYLGVTHAPASRAVAALARKRLVSVRTDPTDRRIRTVELTPAGRTLLHEDPVHRLSSVIDTLPLDERRAFATALEEVYDKLVRP